MDFSEEGLDRIEAAQRSTEVSQEQCRQSYTPLNLIMTGLSSLSSRGLLLPGGEDTTPPMEETESVPEFFINLRLSDLFDLPGEYVLMNVEMCSALSDGNKEWLEKLRSHETPMACLRSDRGDSVLHLVAAWGYHEAVKNIVSECPCLLLEPNFKDQLPLHVAAHGGHLAVVEALIATLTFVLSTLSDEEEREAHTLNPYVVKDINGDTALHLALKGGQMESATWLVKANREASFLANKDGISPLYLAVEVGHVSLVSAMLRTERENHPEWRKTNLDSQLEGRRYLAHAALTSMSTDTLDIILNEYPSLVDELDEKGRNCLSFGASMGYYEGVRNLLGRSTDGVFVCDYDGSYPIHKAVEKGYMRVVENILQRCPHSKHLLNREGQNILHIAAYSGRFAIVRYLMRSEETKHLANEQDVDGNTPLHLATTKWRPRAVAYISGPKNLLIQNKKGLTALDIAELDLQPHYIFRERLTLMALVHGHAKNNPRCRTMSLTRPSVAVDHDRNKDYVNALLLVSALVATVTFTAGFTIPGGFRSSTPHLGMATLATDPRLIHFLLFDIIAMLSSVLAVVSLISAQLGDHAVVQSSLNVALPALYISLHYMVFAFLFGMIIVSGNLIWLIVVICLLTCASFVATFIVIVPHMILQTPSMKAENSRHVIWFVNFVDDDKDESYESPTQRSAEIAGSDHQAMQDTT